MATRCGRYRHPVAGEVVIEVDARPVADVGPVQVGAPTFVAWSNDAGFSRVANVGRVMPYWRNRSVLLASASSLTIRSANPN